jgi:tol-pal system protein YbgF
MTCHEDCEAFSDLYENVLSASELASLSQHLEACPACRAEWIAFQKTLQAVTGLGSAEPSPGFATRVRQRLETRPWWHRGLQWLFLPLQVKVPIQALALLLLGLAGVLLYQRSPELQRQAEPPMSARAPVARETPSPVPGPDAPALPGAPERKGQSDEAPSPAGAADLQRDATREEPAVPRTDIPATKPQPSSKDEEGRIALAPLRQANEVGKVTPPILEEKQAEFAPAYPWGPPPPTPSGPSPAGQPVSPGEGKRLSLAARTADSLYSAALTDLAGQRYDRAITGFRTFLGQYPHDSRAPYAHLALGDAYLGKGRHAEAISEYEALAREFPSSPLLPTALYRQAQATLAMGDKTGCQMLREVADRFPRASEAALAREALSRRCP